MKALPKQCKNCQNHFIYSSGIGFICTPCVKNGYRRPRIYTKEQIIKRNEKAKILMAQKMQDPTFREKQNAKNRAFRQKNPQKFRDYLNNRRKNNPSVKICDNLRIRINVFLKLIKQPKTNKFNNYIGCTPSELKAHLESKFLPGMSWENHGTHGWHIDHIKPLSLAKNSDEAYQLCHYTNLQPLWAFDNISKNNKY